MGCDSKRRNTWSFLTKLDSREEAQVDAETQSRSLLGLMPSLHLPSRARVAVEVITPVGSGAKGATVPASPAGHTLVGDPGATQPGLRLPTLRRCVTEACFTLQGWSLALPGSEEPRWSTFLHCDEMRETRFYPVSEAGGHDTGIRLVRSGDGSAAVRVRVQRSSPQVTTQPPKLPAR